MWLCSSSTSIIEDLDPSAHLDILTIRRQQEPAGGWIEKQQAGCKKNAQLTLSPTHNLKHGARNGPRKQGAGHRWFDNGLNGRGIDSINWRKQPAAEIRVMGQNHHHEAG